ncbi:MAG TPA: hypothetical protein VHY37_11715 [Tepidisphaeraceae bacterium]|nr:hypothetical protein [Tepidisphaeraceae bacterium]
MKYGSLLKTMSAAFMVFGLIEVKGWAATPTTDPAPAADAAPQLAVLPAGATVDQVLDALDARGKDFSDLTADVKLSDIDPNLGTSKTRVGHLWLVRQSPTDATLHVVFDKVIDGKFSRPEKHEYLLQNGWLTDRDYHAKLEVKRQVIKPGQKVNLFKLGEGAFPLPIGQDKADVHREFEVTLAKAAPPAADEPKDAIHIVLVPKPGTAMARRFSQIDVWADRQTDMPVRIDTLDQQQAKEESTVLENVKINTPGGLKPTDLALDKIDQTGWQFPPPEPYRG